MTDPNAPACTLAELARRTGATLDGDGSVVLHRVGTLEHAGPGDIAFLANPRYRAQLAGTRASAVIVSPADAHASALPKLVAPDPYATFAAVAQLLQPEAPRVPGIDATARVHAEARVAATASIGPYAIVEAGAQVGERVRVGAHGVIGAGASIAEDGVLHARVTLYPGVVLGPRAVVHSGAVIGADGFGMAESQGRWIRIPQAGRVVLGADCEVGANTTIDRGAIDDTVIGDDVKLDNQIQVGHNCTIGDHTAIAACVGIAGSVRIGRNCRIGGAAMISGHLSIADGTTISGGTVVFGDIDEPGVYTGTFPLLPYAQWQRAAAQIRQLARLRRRVGALEAALRRSAATDAGERDPAHNGGTP
jgi:UDP-3-O-[3-hydroxymyristoyl] glucosamine N-acyltransferase